MSVKELSLQRTMSTEEAFCIPGEDRSSEMKVQGTALNTINDSTTRVYNEGHLTSRVTDLRGPKATSLPRETEYNGGKLIDHLMRKVARLEVMPTDPPYPGSQNGVAYYLVLTDRETQESISVLPRFICRRNLLGIARGSNVIIKEVPGKDGFITVRQDAGIAAWEITVDTNKTEVRDCLGGKVCMIDSFSY